MDTSFVDQDSLGLPPEETALRQWIIAWYHLAVSDGFVEPHYQLDEVTAARLEGYFQVGLTPGEGVDVVFGTLH
jgi:hypothetical protein